MALSVSILSYNATTGLVTLQAVPEAGTEYQADGLRIWGPSNLFSIPDFQRNASTFVFEARNGTERATVQMVTSAGVSLPIATPAPAPAPAVAPVFTGEQKFGYTDGQQIAFSGPYSPVFVRVKNGLVYGIYIEKDPAQAASPLYRLPVIKTRAWMNHLFQDDNLAAAYFEVLSTDNQAETGVVATDFVTTMTVGQAAVRPLGAARPPVVTPPAPAPAPVIAPVPDQVPAPSPFVPLPAPAPSVSTTWLRYGLAAAGLLALVGLLAFVLSSLSSSTNN